MKKEKVKKPENPLKDLIIYGSIILVIILVRTFIVTPVRVNGESMYPTLNDKEIMILNKWDYKFNDIKRFDIVVVNTNGKKIIKRVIGLPGETLKYENGTLYIDGQEKEEPYLKEKTEDFNIKDLGYDKIPSNCYFVLGDNRDNSKDSRIIGCVKKSQIKGKTSLVVLPIKKAGHRN
ncbi:MAG: signal peptidase I [bacterium]|nr:signal peptidase I [bacterium]